MVKLQINITNINIFLRRNDLYFAGAMWFVSRIIIWCAMLLIAPHLPTAIVPSFGWGVFDAWDTFHYRAIATSGYEFVNDGKQHNLAFFPLFPVSIWILMKLGLSFEFAGILINNLGFLATVYCLYFWLKAHCGITTAKWSTAVLALCPLSMFTGVIYTEGLYLFLSTAALNGFDNKKYRWTALCGAMATATRPTGMALIAAFLIAAWKENKPNIAYFAGLLTSSGILLFSSYCAINFGNPLAFIAAQKGWRPSLGFDWQGWLNMLMKIPFGNNWSFGWVANVNGGINDLWHPLSFSVILVISLILWIFHKHLPSLIIYAAYTLVVVLLIWADQQVINNLLNVFMVLGSSYLLWQFRQELTPVMVIYGFCGVGLLLASGGTISLSRLAYGIVPLNIAIGLWLSRFPRSAYFIIGLFMILLGKLAVGFSQEIWVG